MNIFYKPSFYRSIKKITDPSVKNNIKEAILSVKQAKTLKVIPELRKLKGYKKDIYYRIKVDTYRIGITIEKNNVIFHKCLSRKDFYKFFP